MFSTLRKRLHVSPTAVIATLALVFAMTGGAYAAKKYLVTSTKQISPSVLKALQGRAGANGAVGAAGAPGAQGSAGPVGPAGPAGAKGEVGSKGEAGKNGANGTTGKEGSPWTAGGTLPSGKTETGSWVIASSSETLQVTAISFSVPLAAGLDANHAFFIPKNEEGVVHKTECPGSFNEPKAQAGYLCVYTARMTEAEPGGEGAPPIWRPDEPNPGASGAAANGAILVVTPTTTSFQTHYGTWAVTAP